MEKKEPPDDFGPLTLGMDCNPKRDLLKLEIATLKMQRNILEVHTAPLKAEAGVNKAGMTMCKARTETLISIGWLYYWAAWAVWLAFVIAFLASYSWIALI